jgi:peptide/nickel transport system permease protein
MAVAPLLFDPPPATAEIEDTATAQGGARRLLSALLRSRKALVGAVLLCIFGVMAAIPGVIAPYDPSADAFNPGLPPSSLHLLGTTSQGQDIFSQLIWGARESLIIALAVGMATTLVAATVGVAAAYLGGLWDGGLSLVTDVILVVPTFPLIVVVAAYTKGANLVMLILVLVATGWSYGARQLRSQVLSLKRREFLEAARVRGERASYIMMFEVLPTMTSLIVATFLSSALYAVLAAAGLQFVGLGDPNSLSWGTMLYWAQSGEALNVGSPLWAIMPGVCVALLGAAFALLNYAFDELSNPALRSARFTRARRHRLAR